MSQIKTDLSVKLVVKVFFETSFLFKIFIEVVHNPSYIADNRSGKEVKQTILLLLEWSKWHINSVAGET
jgi:hypothetical protein